MSIGSVRTDILGLDDKSTRLHELQMLDECFKNVKGTNKKDRYSFADLKNLATEINNLEGDYGRNKGKEGISEENKVKENSENEDTSGNKVDMCGRLVKDTSCMHGHVLKIGGKISPLLEQFMV